MKTLLFCVALSCSSALGGEGEAQELTVRIEQREYLTPFATKAAREMAAGKSFDLKQLWSMLEGQAHTVLATVEARCSPPGHRQVFATVAGEKMDLRIDLGIDPGRRPSTGYITIRPQQGSKTDVSTTGEEVANDTTILHLEFSKPGLRIWFAKLVKATGTEKEPEAIGKPAQPTKPAYPLWDGHETIADYAKRAGLEPTRTLDLGNGVKLELVLIPAGKFVMGTPRPPETPQIGITLLCLGGLLVLAMAIQKTWTLMYRREQMKYRTEETTESLNARKPDTSVPGGTLSSAPTHEVSRHRGSCPKLQFSLAWLLAFNLSVAVAVLGLVWVLQSHDPAAARRYQGANWIEKPSHEVTLTSPFYIGKYEVSQVQYQQVMGTNPSSFIGPNLPVENVLWDDTHGFCKKATDKTGATVRIPTEAEWEHACRAGKRTDYCSGDHDLDKVGWYGQNSNSKTHPVGRKAPNQWDVFDMHGNVHEWCEDWYDVYTGDSVTDPQGPTQEPHESRSSETHVLRGGGWEGGPWDCRSTSRTTCITGDPGAAVYHAYIIKGSRADASKGLIGFRVVVTVSQLVEPPSR